MTWWNEFWSGASTAHQVFLLALTSAADIAVGKIRVFGISLGIVDILVGRTANTGPFVWHLPPSANQALRDFGITQFLAGVGMKSGEHFAEVVRTGTGLRPTDDRTALAYATAYPLTMLLRVLSAQLLVFTLS